MGGFFKRFKDEMSYLKNKNWTLSEMGKFWDNLEEYDVINSKIYPYQMRFLNSKKLIDEINLNGFNPNNCLDLQTRTGNGSIFWSKKFPDAEYSIADISKNFLEKSKKNLKERNIRFKDYFIEAFPLPFEDNQFDFVISYETIEHISDYKNFFSELVRVTKKNGIIILTCPNISWEIVHFLAAILNINHSEGPHTFLKKKLIDEIISLNKLSVLNYNTTIFLPFNSSISIKLDKIIEKITPRIVKEKLFLRHSYILKK